MDWVFLSVGVVMSTELFLRLPLDRSLNILKIAVQKAVSTIKSPKISDHWKEVVLPYYALQIFTNSLLCFLLLVIEIVPLGVISLVSEQTTANTLDLASSTKGLVFCTIVGIIYFVIRRRVA